MVGPVLGPTIGGYIVEYASWHWVFLINVPVGILAVILVTIFVDEPQAVVDDRKERFKNGLRIDYIGVILIFLGLGFFEYTLDRGLREDWFASSLITTTATIAAISLIVLVIWELNHKDPVINLRLLKNRNFSMTLLIMTITGIILFSTTQLIPQMLQQVLGYSALDAGLALTFGGFATLAAVPFAGRLSDKVDVRFLLFPALIVQGLALWHMSTLTADMSFSDAAIARLFQAVALPFLFVPINAVAYIGLKPTQTAQASSLLNVCRNLGGSIGISVAQTKLANGIQFHQEGLVQNLNPLNPNYNQWMMQAKNMFGGQDTALAVLYAQVQKQAAMLSFLDVFRFLMIVVFVVSPLVFLMKTGRGKAPEGVMH